MLNESALGHASESIRVEKVSTLASSIKTDLAFFFNRAYENELITARPGVLITGDAFVKPLESSGIPLLKSSAVIACPDPYWAMAVLSEKFAPTCSSAAHVPKGPLSSKTNIHGSANVHPSSELGRGVQIGAQVVVEEHAKIGDGTIVYPGCYIGRGVVIGERSVLFPNVSIYEMTRIGKRFRIHAGSVIGSDGFGYAPIKSEQGVMGHQKIYHLGGVVIGDDVEIGANSCVDRGTLGDTLIESEAKLDNLVHMGHNSKVARGAVICGGTCLAGSSSVGEFAYIGGLTGITNHVHVGKGASVGALALVTKDVPPGGTAVGNPQREYKDHFKAHALLSRLLAGKRKERETLK